jgi:N-acetylmuramoyl-L-alanine amidase
MKNYLALIALVCVLSLGGAAVLSRVGTAVAVLMEEDVSPCIVIDAGHGGEDGGTVSATGQRESELNLEISLRLQDFLTFLGLRTRMVRDADVSIETEGDTIAQRKVSDIRNRVKLVEETPNALLVSIHQNHFSEEKYRGAQVFYARTEGSQTLAEQLQESLCSQVDDKNRRRCKQAGEVYLMEHVSCTAVLVECGFLSNREETLLLQSAEYQKKLAAAIAVSLLNYTEDIHEV